MTDVLPHLVGGAFRDASGTARERRNPSDPADLVARAPVGTRDDIDAAVAAAVDAFATWRVVGGPARAEALYRWGAAIAARSEELRRRWRARSASRSAKHGEK